MEILQFFAEQIHTPLLVVVWCTTITVPVGLAFHHLVRISKELRPGWGTSIWWMTWPGLINLAIWPLFVLWAHHVVSPISTGHIIDPGSPAAYWAVWGYPVVVGGIPTLGALLLLNPIGVLRKHWVDVVASVVALTVAIPTFVVVDKWVGTASLVVLTSMIAWMIAYMLTLGAIVLMTDYLRR